MAGRRVRRKCAVVVACTLLLLTSFPTALTFPYDPEEHTRIRLVDEWRDPGGAGADLRFDIDTEGERMLLVGYGAPGEVRVTDMDLGNATVLEPPSPGFFARGAEWSNTDQRILVWGDAPDGPPFAVYDLPSYRRNVTAGWMDLVDLVEVTEVSMFADDIIATVAGRDANGTSHLLILEAHQNSIRWDHVWEGNHTIQVVAESGAQLVIADSGGTISILDGGHWAELVRYPGALHGGVVSWEISYDHPWGFGDAEGGTVMSRDHPFYPQFNVSVGDGPVTGFAWTRGRPWDHVTAVQLPGDWTRLDAWQISAEGYQEEDVPVHMSSLRIEGSVSMMGTDPRGWSRVLVAMEDGTLASYVMDVRPKPEHILPNEPDHVDGRGLEPLAAWHMDGEPAEGMSFLFNNAGSLVALQGFDGPRDLRVINRTFDVVAELGLPGGEFFYQGMTWSSTDRWLVYWGTVEGGGETDLVVRAFDVPSFKRSTSFDTDMISDVTYEVWDMLFLPGDEVVALLCSTPTSAHVLKLMDLGTGEVLKEVLAPIGVGLVNLEWDGDTMVATGYDSHVYTVPPPYEAFEPTGIRDRFQHEHFSVNASSGWCYASAYHNVTAMNGTPRNQALRFKVEPGHPIDVSWTGVPGDFVLGYQRLNQGTTLQLWRMGAGMEDDWRSVGGARMLSELNSSRTVKQVEADPAFPGVMAVLFTDGTLALYHLNLTPYPPPPEELGGLSIDPRIPSPEDGNGTGPSDDGWGTDLDRLFPVFLVAAIVVLLAVLVLLRSREGDGEDEG